MKLLYLVWSLFLVAAANDTPALKELKHGNLQFSAKAYKELSEDNLGKNFLVSPLSVEIVLALVEFGGVGKTAQELIAGLSLPNNEHKIKEAIKAIAPGLNVDDKYTLSSANKIYLKNGFSIKKDFKHVATNVFKAEVEEINFEDKEAAVTQINKWVLDKTHDKIKDLLTADDVDKLTRLVLINALYFHGYWVNEFYVDFTKEKPFVLSNKQEVQVKIMEQTSWFEYYEDTNLKAKYLRMHYKDSPISMTFILPDTHDGLAALEANIEQVLKTPKFVDAKVHVQIPHVNIEQKIDFVPILKKVGIKDAFEDWADFSRLSDNPVKISKVIQKTFIDVEEKGTTAAAATAVVMIVPTSAFIEPPTVIKEFEANHPFIFTVQSDEAILFVGRFVDPSK